MANLNKVVETPNALSLWLVTWFNLRANIGDQLSENLETGGCVNLTSGNVITKRNKSPPTYLVIVTRRKSRQEVKWLTKV